MTTTIKVYFKWDEYRPDNRQYKQQSMLVWPLLDGDEVIKVEMDLPVSLLANAEEYLKAEIEGNKPPTPIFTIKAQKYLVDEWEKVFSDISPDDFKPAVDNGGWDDPSTEEETKAAKELQNADDNWPQATPQNDEWGDTIPQTDNENWDEVVIPETEAEPWDEKQEDWGHEPNFDN
jgi:hypothetical protein